MGQGQDFSSYLILIVLGASLACASAAEQAGALSQNASSSASFSLGRNSTVLVLGSAGAVGRALVALLQKSGHRVLEVPSRNSLDLRLPGALKERFGNDSVSCAFLLAGEVSERLVLEVLLMR